VTQHANPENIGRRFMWAQDLAKQLNSILAISDDFYGFRVYANRRPGIIIQNGVILANKGLRQSSWDLPTYDFIAYFPDGSLKAYLAGSTDAEALLAQGATDTWCFGPVLLSEGQIGAQVLYMTPEVSAQYLQQVTEAEIDAELALDAKKYHSDITFLPEYREATRSGLAIRKWMEAEQLNACTVNFLTLDICGLPKMPFIECCKIMERGCGYAGEGDTLTAGLVGALISQYPNTTFTEMFCPDWEENVILLSHMAESNPNLAQWAPLLADMPFRYNSCGDTVGMYNCLRPGKVVYVNLAPMGNHFHMIVTEGEMIDAGLPNGAYSHNTQGWFKPCKALPQFLEEYSMAGGTHHSAMVYDADVEEIKAFGRILGFQVIEIR